MKKLLVLVLALVMIFSLTACGGGESNDNDQPKVAIVGSWECAAENSTLVLNEDETGEVNNNGNVQAITWMYDEPSHAIIFTLAGTDMTEDGTYFEDKDLINVDGWVYNRVTE